MADEKGSALQALERNAEGLESQMREQIARTRAGATTILIFGIIIVVCVGIVFFKFGGEMKVAMEPESVVESIHGFMGGGEQVVKLVGEIKDNVKASIPDYVATTRRELMNAMPAVREKVEGIVGEKVDEFCVTFDQQTDEMFKLLIEEQHEKLGPLVEVAAVKGPESQQPLEDALREALESFIGPKLDETMMEFNRELATVEARLDRIAAENAGPDAEWERKTIEKFLLWLDEFFETGFTAPDEWDEAAA